jgi:hypothetical protein
VKKTRGVLVKETQVGSVHEFMATRETRTEVRDPLPAMHASMDVAFSKMQHKTISIG